MRTSPSFEQSRRRFITGIIPACSALCLGGSKVLALTRPHAESFFQEDTHMFDWEFPKKLTFRQFVDAQNFSFIDFAKAVQKRFGKEETIELIRKGATEFNLERGRKQAEQSADRSLKSYTRMFANPKSWEGILKMEVVEETETAFELKVTECLQAVNFIGKGAADIGYAHVCWGDYAWAEGFNPKIKLVRDKTLMQGHAYCNHRYIITG